MHIIDLSYYYSAHINNPELLLRNHHPNMGYVNYLPSGCQVSVIKFMNYEGKLEKDGVSYYFFRGSSSRFWIPYTVHQFIKQLQPDVILLHGLIYPCQVIGLKKKLGPNVKLTVQHHAEQPTRKPISYLQKIADGYIDAYLFTAKEIAAPWLEKKIIKSAKKIVEVTEGSTHFKKMPKEEAQHFTGISGNNNFLWVGRLDKNKDPLTVVKAFLQYVQIVPESRLYMIYQGNELAKRVMDLLAENDAKNNIVLLGNKPHEELLYWYNSVDFFLSGSHKEGSGYALIEAMACGCIPVVTDIPSFWKITGEGRIGFLYERGNVPALFAALCSLKNISRKEYSAKVIAHFNQNLSFKSIADGIYTVCKNSMQV
jgi:glycosyltransferase involved in cell wall biosynthesis